MSLLIINSNLVKYVVFIIINTFVLTAITAQHRNQPNLKPDSLIVRELKTEYSQIFCTAPELPFDKVAILDFAFNRFLAGDVTALLDLAADDLVFEVSGPVSDTTHYGTFYGKEGFIQFCLQAYRLFNVEEFNVHYYVADGYHVNVLIREKFLFNHSQARAIAEFNEHIIFNEQGKIKYFGIIQDTYSQLKAISGKPGELFYNKNLYQSHEVKNYHYCRDYNRAIGWQFYEAIKSGNFNSMSSVLASNVKFVIGNKNIAPYCGKYNGKNQIKQFLEAFRNELEAMAINSIVCENNKAIINMHYTTISTITGKKFEGNAKFALQLNKEGKIVDVYFYADQYGIYNSNSHIPQLNSISPLLYHLSYY